MWPDRVVMMSPSFDQHFSLLQRVEDFHVQYLVSELAVEALIVTVLLGDPGAINIVFTPTLASQFLTALAVNSGPLSDRM